MKDVIQCANNVFEQPWWLDIVAPGRWGEAIVKEKGEVIGRWPYVLKKGNLVMPPNTQTLGIWIKEEYRQHTIGNSSLGKQKEIINELVEQLPPHRNLKICLDSSNKYILPFRWLGYRYEPSFSYRINNLENMTEVEGNYHKSLKKNLRRAEKKTIISNENDPELLIYEITKTFERQGRKNPENEKLIKAIVTKSIDRNSGRMFVARDLSGNIQVVALLIYDNNVSYALLSGSDERYRGSESKSYVYAKEIEYASCVSKSFDFEGSNIEGIENIIRQFGCSQVINYTISKQSLFRDCLDMAKPKVKNLLGYKI